jgi:hypothetical protein
VIVRRTTGDEARVADPRAGSCERCGVAEEGDLRLLVLRGRDRYAERTVCDGCAEELFELFIDALTDDELGERNHRSIELVELDRGRF